MQATSEGAELKEISTAKRRLLEQRLAGRRAPAETIPQRVAGTRIPLSVEQHRVWLHTAMAPDVPIYNESITIHRRGSFDLQALEDAFNDVLRRHEIWRTTFVMEQDGSSFEQEEISQIVHPELRIALSLTDLSALPEEQREAEACRIATKDAVVAIDLKTLPLFKARVFRLAEDDHRLQMTLHHIIFDGVSIHRVFVPELAATYAEIVAGGRLSVRAPGLQYGDYAIWRDGQMNSPVMDQHTAYWMRELAGELPVLKLPTDRPRPAVMSHRGSMEWFELPSGLTPSLRSFSRNHGVTLYMTMLAALKTLFFRYSGHEDLIVGGLSDGRRRSELEQMMGYFLDTFAIRTRPHAELPFSTYLGQVRNAVLGALAAAELPFNRVVQAIQTHRDHSHHPIFQTFLALQPAAESFPEGWDISKPNVSAGAAKFDIYIEVDERAEDASLRIMYSTDLFDAETIQRMGAHWITMLTAITETPECRLGDLPLLTPGERELMLKTWNQTGKEVEPETLHGMVEARVRSNPNAVAIAFEEQTLTYAELEKRANHLAAILREKGAACGELVAVCMERSEDLPVALLAILKTGAAYLPLDPGTPRARRLICLEDARPAIILTQKALLDDLPAADLLAAGTVIVDVEEAFRQVMPVLPEAPLTRLGDAAYVIHTSGSTGRPKGVEISHGAIVNLLVSMQEKPGFGAGDTLLALTTISFDIAGLELFLPLITGGKVVVVTRTVALDPDLLSKAIDVSGCTVVQATPATWRNLLATGWRGRPGLRLLCGGEAMTRDLADGLLGLKLEVWNVYGPTETTVWSTVQRVTAGRGTVPVGRPIANTSTYILDQNRNPVPIGVAGELYIGGSGLANGYRDQPQLTGEKFALHSVGERLYRTGDHALYRADGTIEIQGRADNQVKIRGYRIELEDVEASVAAHPKVGAALAKAWPDRSGGYRLSVYITGKEGSVASDAELREFLATRVPEYMIPSDIVVLEAMPLTSNGKMDRKALQEPVHHVTRMISVPPSTEEELRLAAIWMDLLGVAAVNLDDNFFDLGGHSLLVARLQQRIFVEFRQRVAMAAIFYAPTIAGQVLLLEAGDHSDRSRLLPLQTKGSKPRIFWLQPPPLIKNLVAGVGTDQPLYGVTVTMEDLESLGRKPDIQDFAAICVKTILGAQASGPYYLGGLCTSGILAYEVAWQLTQRGETVASLVMLDAENPVFYRRFDTLAIELNKLLFYGQRAVRKSGMRMFLRHMQSRVMRLISLEKAAATEMSAIEGALLSAAFRYEPPDYAGDVLLLLPKDRPVRVNYLPGWQAVVKGPLKSIDVAGHHDELLDRQNAEEIARVFLSHFDEATLRANVLSHVG